VTTKTKPEAFARSVTKNPPDQGWHAELHAENGRGWSLTAIRAPYYGDELQFVQVDHPDGTSSYFRSDDAGDVCAGPFGGGYSWAVPKYVVTAARELLYEAFPDCGVRADGTDIPDEVTV
jgi:hypothetical protein